MKNVSLVFTLICALALPVAGFACDKSGKHPGCGEKGAHSAGSDKACGCDSCQKDHKAEGKCGCSGHDSGSCAEKEADEPKAGCGADVSYKCAGQKAANGVSVAPGGKCTGDVDCCCWGGECLGNATCCKKLGCKKK
jgi:hypothetical protein